MPYICHIHHGLYESSADVEGCQNETCLAFAQQDIPPAGIVYAGPTAQRLHEKTFNNDMHQYREAVRQGVEPDQVTAVAAQQALKDAENGT